jgi:shikimate 5-dehydrogenase
MKLGLVPDETGSASALAHVYIKRSRLVDKGHGGMSHAVMHALDAAGTSSLMHT